MIFISPPPFRIYLLRHAEAAFAGRGGRDFDRPLSDAGRVQADIASRAAAEKGYEPALVIASTALRCRQTAEAVKRVVGPAVEFRYADALYNAGANAYLDIIAGQVSEPSVMLVGHNPTIELTLAALIGADAMAEALGDGYPTAGLAVIDAVEPGAAAPTGWILSDFLTA